jgi:pilus assembly protein Flp/PilA
MYNFSKFLKDDSGAAAAEYVLIIAVIGGLVALGGAAFGGSLSTALTTIGTFLTTKASAI